MVSQHAQSSPVREFLLDHFCCGFGLQPQRVAAKVQEFSARGIAWVMEFLGEAGEGIRRVMGGGGRELKILPGQAGARMIVPQTLQVRCWRLE
jgi:hypothetical protein